MTSRVKASFCLLGGPQVAARANVASSLSSFMKVIASEAAFEDLRAELRRDRTAVITLLDLVQHTVGYQPIDPRFESPYDVQLASSLLACAAERSLITGTMAAIVSRAPNVWWAERLSEHIRANGNGLVTSFTPSSHSTVRQLRTDRYVRVEGSRAPTVTVAVAAATVFALATYTTPVRDLSAKNAGSPQIVRSANRDAPSIDAKTESTTASADGNLV